MGGTELVSALFLECPSSGSAGVPSPLCVFDPGNAPHVWAIVRAILVALVVKAALTIITFGIKVPAGIFIPTLGVGACAGRILGIAVQWLQWRYPGNRMWSVCHGDSECVIPGLYAMVGAAATLSGVTVRSMDLSFIFFPCGRRKKRLAYEITADDGVASRHHVRVNGYAYLCCAGDAVCPRGQNGRGRSGTQGHLRPCY
jgi:hypothetical protein